MQDPAVESVFEMPQVERDEEIRALPADHAHHTLTNGICLGRSGRRPQYRTPISATPLSNSREKMLSRS